MVASFNVHVPLYRPIDENGENISKRKNDKYLTERDQDTLVERSRFIVGFLQRLKQMVMKLFGVRNIMPDVVVKHQIVKPLRHAVIERGGKDPRGLEDRMRCPFGRLCNVQNVFPIGQGGNDLEQLGQFARLVPRQDLAHSKHHLFEFSLLFYASKEILLSVSLNNFILDASRNRLTTGTLLHRLFRFMRLNLLHDNVRQRLVLRRCGTAVAHEHL